MPLGQFGHYELFVDPQEQRKFPQFAVFILAAATQSDSSNSGGAGGNSNAQSNKPPPGWLDAIELGALDLWIEDQPDPKHTRQEAARRLTNEALVRK